MAMVYKSWPQTWFVQDQRHSTLLVSHPPRVPLVIVSIHLWQPVWAMDPLLVLICHGRAGYVQDVVAVSHGHWLATQETILTKSFFLFGT